MATGASVERFVALDVHKHYVMVAAIDAAQHVVLAPRKQSLERFVDWAPEHLQPTDQVVLEATTNAWTLYDQLAPLVQQVKIVHPLLVKLISSARVKTDTRDTLHLARLLAAGLIPQVWVPPPRCASCACWWPIANAWSGSGPRPRTACTACCMPTRSYLQPAD